MVKRLISLILNAAIAVAVFVSWGSMAFSVEGGVLTAPGLRSLKYFTVLSNLLQAFASVAYVFFVARALTGRVERAPRAVTVLKYAGTVSVSLTFLVVVLFLGPVLGYRGLFDGVSFWLHLVVPLAAAFDFCALDREGSLRLRDSLWAILPMLLYGVGYVLNLLVNGRVADWYGFATAGMGTLPFVLAGIALAAWCVALLERLPRRG